VRAGGSPNHGIDDLAAREGDSPALGRALLAPPYLPSSCSKVDPERASLLVEVAGKFRGGADRRSQAWLGDGGDQVHRAGSWPCASNHPTFLLMRCAGWPKPFMWHAGPAAQALLADGVVGSNAQILLAHCEVLSGADLVLVTQETWIHEHYEKPGREPAASLRRCFGCVCGRRWRATPWCSAPGPSGAFLLGLAAFSLAGRCALRWHGAIALLLAIPPILRLVHLSGVAGWSGLGPRTLRDGNGRDGSRAAGERLRRLLPGVTVPSAEKDRTTALQSELEDHRDSPQERSQLVSALQTDCPPF